MTLKYSQLHPLRDDIYLYKYLPVDRFGQLLAENALKFNRADQLIEYHNGILSPAERKHLHSKFLKGNENQEGRKLFNRTVSMYKRLCHQTYLCCWSTSLNEQLMEKYLPEGNGIAIRVSAYDLKNELMNTLEFLKPEFFEIQYVDYENETDCIPEGLHIFGRKRLEFLYESEVRIAIMTESKKTNPEAISVKINPDKIIDEIIVAPNATREAQMKLLNWIEEHKLYDKASNVTFYNSPAKQNNAHRPHIQPKIIQQQSKMTY